MMEHTKNVYVIGIVTLLLLGSTAWGQSSYKSGDGDSSSSMSSQRTQGAQQQVHQRAPSQLHVTSAEDLVGRTVRDTQGREAGQVAYLMIDTQSGDVRYAIIGSGGQLDIGNDLIAVPWSAVDVKQQVLTLNRSLSEMRQAPRFSEDRLSDLTQPSVAAMVYNYYLVPEEQSQQGNQGQQQSQQPQQSNQRQQQAQQRQQSQQSGNQGQQQAQTEQPQLLVGRDIVTMLIPPSLKSTREVRGTDVMSMNGQEVGSIDKIMIDTDHGHIAYILLDHGSFLGIGGDWLPVPYDAMQWSTSDQQYTLSVADRTLQQMPKLPKQDLPTTVKVSQLQAFYDQYGVTPYWQQLARTTQMGEPAHGAISATVQTVNDQQGTVTLQTSNGNTVEFEVSQEMLSNLQAGDSVEVSIRPTSQQQGQRSGTQSQ